MTLLTDSSHAPNEAYENYLKVLGQVGPKEGETISSVKIQPNTSSEKESQDKIQENLVVNPTPVKEKPSINSNEDDQDINIGAVDHKPFGVLLKKYVDARGNVNYKGLKNERAKLDAYIATLQSNPVSSNMSKNERLAYWINTYNAFTLQLILDNYPVSSIKDIAGGKPWDKLFITLGSTTYSLNIIENNIIRKRFSEPRIHFAVNCAAASCPPLLNDAYYPDRLMDQLDERTRSFISNTSYNTINSKEVEISKIFEWYGKDFGIVKSFLTPYISADISKKEIKFKEYDWSLNKQ